MERKQLNAIIQNLKRKFGDKLDDELTSIKLLEILEMLISQNEETELLIKERLEEILNINH